MPVLKLTPPLMLRLDVSRILASLLALIHIGACGLLFVLPWGLTLKLALVVLLLVNLFVVLRKFPGLSRPKNIQAIEWCGDGSWFIRTFAGKQFTAQLQPSSFVHPWLVILNFHLQEEKGLRSVVLFPDALDRETLRCLRVRLAIEGCTETSS